MFVRAEREPIIRLIDGAVASGARQRATCKLLAVNVASPGTPRAGGRRTHVQAAHPAMPFGSANPRRSVSDAHPILPALKTIAAHCEPYSI